MSLGVRIWLSKDTRRICFAKAQSGRPEANLHGVSQWGKA